jgi:Fe-S cluster assembly protein SufD
MTSAIETEITQHGKKILDKSPYSPSYKQKQNEAFQFFKDTGLPTKKDENWIYSSLSKNLSFRPFDSESFVDSSQSAGMPEAHHYIDRSSLIVFNNGKFNREKSNLPNGVKLSSVQNTLTNELYHDVFDALNLALSQEAQSFVLEKNTALAVPLTIVYQNDPWVTNKIVSNRVHFLIEENVNATIVEMYACSEPSLIQYTHNSRSEFKLQANSQIKHIKIIEEAKKATHVSLTKAHVSRDALFQSTVFDLGLLSSRVNLEIHLNEENARGESNGLFSITETEHADHFTNIFHHRPHTFSSQLYKGILNKNSHGAFTGKISMDQFVSGSESSQLNKNLLLSKKAHIDTRPQLLVATDDVKCSHGATIGELSSDEEFYLISRGISKERARKLLGMGFLLEILYLVTDKNDDLFQFISKKLSQLEFSL